MKINCISNELAGKKKPLSALLPIKTVLLALMISFVFSSCFKLFDDGDGPTNVHWKGRVLDAVSDQPLAGQDQTYYI